MQEVCGSVDRDFSAESRAGEAVTGDDAGTCGWESRRVTMNASESATVTGL